MTTRFGSQLCVELKSGSDSIWILTAPLFYLSEKHGLIVVPTGFETDFASVPRVPIAYRLWGDRAHREAALHDYLFRKNAIPLLSYAEANSVFLEAMESRNVPWHIRWPMYLGVCAGGWWSYYKRRVEEL